MKENPSLITRARQQFHQQLVTTGTLSVAETAQGLIASNADRSQKSSRTIALNIALQLQAQIAEKGAGQTTGAGFEQAVAAFVENTFVHMQSIRPGEWKVRNVGGSRRADHLSDCEPYTHLADLAEAVRMVPAIGAALGNSYVIAPDILILRNAVADSIINAERELVDTESALLSPIRESNKKIAAQFVHAVISCKFTMRSDRAQNTRAEALNLIRNRKGRAPHIIAVTAEPSLSRIASLALGTGDIDMVYHFALPELGRAVEMLGSEESKELLETLVAGNRLRDIADLPLDLCV